MAISGSKSGLVQLMQCTDDSIDALYCAIEHEIRNSFEGIIENASVKVSFLPQVPFGSFMAMVSSVTLPHHRVAIDTYACRFAVHLVELSTRTAEIASNCIADVGHREECTHPQDTFRS